MRLDCPSMCVAGDSLEPRAPRVGVQLEYVPGFKTGLSIKVDPVSDGIRLQR